MVRTYNSDDLRADKPLTKAEEEADRSQSMLSTHSSRNHRSRSKA